MQEQPGDQLSYKALLVLLCLCGVLCAGYDVDTLANVSVLGGVYNTGSSCLHLAAQHGHLPMVERLLASGANPKVADYR